MFGAARGKAAIDGNPVPSFVDLVNLMYIYIYLSVCVFLSEAWVLDSWISDHISWLHLTTIGRFPGTYGIFLEWTARTYRTAIRDHQSQHSQPSQNLFLREFCRTSFELGSAPYGSHGFQENSVGITAAHEVALQSLHERRRDETFVQHDMEI